MRPGAAGEGGRIYRVTPANTHPTFVDWLEGARLRTLPAALALMLLGVLINGISGAVYIGAQLGAGARDGLMTGLGRVLSRPVGPVRIVLEVIVLVSGWLLGGPLGLGTVVYAIALGPVIQLTLPRVLVPVRSVRGEVLGPAR